MTGEVDDRMVALMSAVDIADTLHRMPLEFYGDNRMGRTELSFVFRNEFAADVPFPNGDRRPDETFDDQQRFQWYTSAVVFTLLDNVYLLDRDEGTDWVMMDAVRFYLPFIETCTSATLQVTFHHLLDRWESFDPEVREGTTVGYYSEAKFVREASLRVTLNRNASPQMMMHVLGMSQVTAVEIFSILEGRPPEVVWEYVLFMLRWDVTGHRFCPAHLRDTYMVAN